MEYKRTKIICTIGPASWDYETLKDLAHSGMSAARLNMSHGTHEEKREQISKIRKVSEETGIPITIIADLQGPKLRLGEIEGIRQIIQDEEISLSIEPREEEIPVQYDLSPYLAVGDRIYLNDGLVELKVIAINNKSIKTIAQNKGIISTHKGVNIPDTMLTGNVFTPKDEADALFAIAEKVDYLALSFVQTPENVKTVKALLEKHSSQTKLISKIEKAEAVANIEEIIEESDAVMVARGDLAIETQPQEVPVIQQKIIRIARQKQKPVIIATQMLESMTENPRPTRAEVSDVAKAVLDETDAVMLSAESATGKYPKEAVKIMNDIIVSVERDPEYKNYIKINWANILNENLSFSAIAAAAASLAYRIQAKTIIVSSASGRTARLLSSFRPGAQVVAVTHDEITKNQLNLVWGIQPIIVKPVDSFDGFIEEVTNQVKSLNNFPKNSKAVVVTGSEVGVSGGVDTIKLIDL